MNYQKGSIEGISDIVYELNVDQKECVKIAKKILSEVKHEVCNNCAHLFVSEYVLCPTLETRTDAKVDNFYCADWKKPERKKK